MPGILQIGNQEGALATHSAVEANREQTENQVHNIDIRMQNRAALDEIIGAVTGYAALRYKHALDDRPSPHAHVVKYAQPTGTVPFSAPAHAPVAPAAPAQVAAAAPVVAATPAPVVTVAAAPATAAPIQPIGTVPFSMPAPSTATGSIMRGFYNRVGVD